jgi:hypothetical protein
MQRPVRCGHLRAHPRECTLIHLIAHTSTAVDGHCVGRSHYVLSQPCACPPETTVAMAAAPLRDRLVHALAATYEVSTRAALDNAEEQFVDGVTQVTCRLWPPLHMHATPS